MKLHQFYTTANNLFAQLNFPGEPKGLFEPINYSIKNGGKRMRPVLTMLSAHLFGAEIEKAYNPAIGLELFHNFTLIHDDIMDNAPLRRGQPTVFTKWNINTAILSGDALFALAGEFMTRVDDAHLRKVMELYHTTVVEVCKGQQYDMDFEHRKAVSLDEYLEMIRLKTAVLPAACLKAGGIVAGASEENLQLVYDFGLLLGLAFQIKDDWLDLYGDFEKFGKSNGGDILANKKTWLYIKALELADQNHYQALTQTYSSKTENPENKIALVKDIFGKLQIERLALVEAEKLFQGALGKLKEVDAPQSKKELLHELAQTLLSREV